MSRPTVEMVAPGSRSDDAAEGAVPARAGGPASSAPSRWKFQLVLDGTSGLPLYLQIARTITDDVRRGRLRAGDKLPGTRALARALAVHRNTVLAAYGELAAEGWIRSDGARGTYVASGAARPSLGESLPPSTVGRRNPGKAECAAGAAQLGKPAEARSRLVIGSDTPDPRLVPIEDLGRAYRRVLRIHRRSVLDYAGPEGHPRLRQAVSDMLRATRALPVGPESVLITRGSQMALALAGSALFGPSDVIAVEDLGLRNAWEALALSGARLVPIPMDAEGLSVEALREAAARHPVRAVYVTPQYQYPTTVTLSPRRRLALLAFAREAGAILIEDDYDHPIHFEGAPTLPLAGADAGGNVVYVGSLSKVLAPGLRIGFVVAPPATVKRLAAHRQRIDGQGDPALEAAVAELIEDGRLQQHLHRARRAYLLRRDVLLEALRAHLDGALAWRRPNGGTALWARVADAIDVEEWAARAQELGVFFHTGRRFAFDRRPRPFIRLGFSRLNEPELIDAVGRMSRALSPAPR